MNCIKCGAPLPDGAAFCSSCGASQNVGQSTTTGGNPSPLQGDSTIQSISPFPQPPVSPKKKGFGTGGIIAVAGGAAVFLIAAIVIFATTAHGAFLRTFGSSKAYFEYVQSREAAKTAESLSGVYSAVTQNTPYNSSHSTLRLNVSQNAKDLLASYSDSDMDLSFLDDLALDMDITSSDNLASLALNLNISNENIISASVVTDILTGDAFMSVPELTDKIISSKVDMDAFDNISSQIEFGANILKALPPSEVSEKLFTKYIDIFSKNVGDVYKKKASLSAGNITEDCVKLTVELDKNDILNIAEAALTEAKSDNDIESAIKDVESKLERAGEDVGNLYGEFISWIDDALYDIRDARAEGFYSSDTLTIEEYVNKKHEIVGTTVSLNGEPLISFASPSKGSDFALDLTVFSYDGEIHVSGSGDRSGSETSGTFDISVSGESVGSLELINVDSSDLANNNFSGIFRFTPSRELLSKMDFGSAIALFSPALELKLDLSKNSGNIDINILSGGETLFGLSLDSKASSSSTTITKPSGDLVDLDNEDDLTEFMRSLDFTSVAQSLANANVPDEIVERLYQLQSNIDYAYRDSDYYDYYDDYYYDDYDYNDDYDYDYDYDDYYYDY